MILVRGRILVVAAAVILTEFVTYSHNFKFQDLNRYLGIFKDCDSLLYTEGRNLDNMNELKFPVYNYFDRNKYSADIKSNPRFPNRVASEYIASLVETQGFYHWLRRRNCVAQFHFIFTKTYFKDPKRRLADLFHFTKTESVFVYSILISPHSRRDVHPNFFQWNLGGYNASIFNTKHEFQLEIPQRQLSYLLFFRIKYEPSKHLKILTLRKPTSLYKLIQFEIWCSNCKRDDVLTMELSRFGNNEFAYLLELFAETYGTLPVMSNLFKILHQNVANIMYVTTFQYETDTLKSYEMVLPELERRMHSPYSSPRRSSRRLFIGNSAPPELIVYVHLKEKFPNMTFFTIDKAPSKDNPCFADAIRGPVARNIFLLNTMQIRPVHDTSISFVSCLNVSIIRPTGIFSKPFDASTWFFLFVTTTTFSVFLSYTIQQSRNLEVRIRLFQLPWGILLENADDFRKPGVMRFRALIITMSIVGIVLSNSYKCFLASDFTALSIHKGPETFDELLLSNTTLVATYSLPVYVTTSLKTRTLFQPSFNHQHFAIRVFLNFEKKLPNITHLATKIFDAVDWPARKMPFRLENAFKCNNTAIIGFTHDLGKLQVPAWRRPSVGTHPFVFSKEKLLRGSLSWSLVGWRDGLAFQYIVRQIEGGIYHQLVRMTSRIRPEYMLSNLIAATRKDSDRPLSLHESIMSSIFHLWTQLILLSCIILLLELAFFSFDEVVLKVLNALPHDDDDSSDSNED